MDAYNDPKAEADLGVYDKEFDLPPLHACSGSESGCFEQVGQSGTGALPFPRSETEREAKEAICVAEKAGESKLQLKRREEACAELVEAEGWAVEISTDIEVAHAVCQNCRILLVEASTAAYPNLEAGEETAVRLGASEVSNSWGGAQEGSSGQAFDHPGMVITAAAGDDGYLNWTEVEAAAQAQSKGEARAYFVGADYPAASPDVVAVGGTKLLLSEGIRQQRDRLERGPQPRRRKPRRRWGRVQRLLQRPTLAASRPGLVPGGLRIQTRRGRRRRGRRSLHGSGRLRLGPNRP